MDPTERDAILTEIEALRADLDATDEEAERTLLDRMAHADAEVREAACEAVWEFYHVPAVLDRALALVREDPDPRVARAALVALGRVIQEGTIDEVEDRPIETERGELDLDPAIYWKVREALLAAANDEALPVGVQRFAVESLGYAGGRSDVAALLLEWHGRPEPEARRSALFAMGLSGSAEFEREIRRHLDDADAETRLVAIRAAGLARIGEAREAVLAASRETDARVRQAAARALGGFGGDDVLDRLEELLDDPDERVREAARDSLETSWDAGQED